MSIGPVNPVPASAAGSPVAQTSGSVADRAATTVQQRQQIDANESAEQAAGIGPADGQDSQSSQRDPDGRRPWETAIAPDVAAESADQKRQRLAKDASGQCGNRLDLAN